MAESQRPGAGVIAPSTEEAAAYFETVWSAAGETLHAGAVPETRSLIGPDILRVRTASAPLHAALTSALRPAESAGASGLDLIAWETGTSAIPFPMLPRAEGDIMRHGRVERLCDAAHVVIWEAHYHTVTLLHLPTSRAVFAIDAAERLPYDERAAPLKPLLNAWAAGAHRGQVIHGAAVARAGRGLLLTAPGGSGKSTTALLALQAGWEYLADDWCLVTQAGGPRLHSIYHTAKLHWDNVHRVPAMENLIVNRAHAAGQKAVLALGASRWRGQFRRGAELAAIVIPQVQAADETTFTRGGALRALHAMLLVTVRSISGSGRESIELLTALAQAAPVYTLALGRDLAKIPPVLERILAENPALPP